MTSPHPLPGFKSRQEIASELNICDKTLRKKLTEKGLQLPKGLLNAYWQQRIYEALAAPPPPALLNKPDD